MPRGVVVAVLGAALATPCVSWGAERQAGDVAARVAAVLRWTGVEDPPPAEVQRLAELWTKAQQPGLTAEQRQAAFRDLYVQYAKLHGRDLTGRPQALDGAARFAATAFEGGGRMDLGLPEPRGTPTGRHLHGETTGRGATRLLLISDLGVDGRKLYESFARRNADRYAMHLVTLPWSGAARPLPWPETLDHTARTWLTQIERELLALLDRPELQGAVVVGTSAGGYFATRLALLRPGRVRAVVVVDALVAAPMRASASPDAPAPPAERLSRLKSVPPAPQFFPVAPIPRPDELARLIDDPKSTHPTARNWMAFAAKDDVVTRSWTFEALSGGFFVPSPLPAGTYTFFVIPGEGEWTAILNRVPRQWGAFNYDPAFDALRFTVKPAGTDRQEHLRYAIEPTGPSSARVTLAWETMSIGLGIESSPD